LFYHWEKACPLLNPIEHTNQDAPQYAAILDVLVLAGVAAFALMPASGSN
jgi:hypothetical protein